MFINNNFSSRKPALWRPSIGHQKKHKDLFMWNFVSLFTLSYIPGPTPQKAAKLIISETGLVFKFWKKIFQLDSQQTKNSCCQDNGERWCAPRSSDCFSVSCLQKRRTSISLLFRAEKTEKYRLCPNWVGNQPIWVTEHLSGMNKLVLPWDKVRTWKLVTLHPHLCHLGLE